MEQIKQRKIVFLVYKAGWWGCFDSLYRKLSQDEMNECYVIPIPYYERRAGIIDYSKRHYEAHNLPEDIPVTDYNVFHLSEQNPDIIYIHNPYDGQSPIDTVDIEYYSYNLKKCTDSLVYIPHMLYLDGVPEQLKSSVVYQNVDQILIANKVVANAFHHVTKEKFQISRSPLVDYLEKVNTTIPGIPCEWKAQLTNGQDFGGRRVIFYHVGFTDLHFGTERAIAKIEYVFDYMKTREDIILVWKPEIEIEARLEELPKGVSFEYLRLKQRFLDEKLGIIDTTEDEVITSVLADAYMGDQHPIMNLFGLQGKPIYQVDRELRYLPSDDELCSASCLDFTVEEDTLWFVADEYDLLCKMNLITGDMEVVDEIPNEKWTRANNYCGIVKKENGIYLNPLLSETIMKYNVDNREFSAIYLPDTLSANFDYIVPYKEYLFLKAKEYPAIVRYHTKTKELTYYKDWVEELELYVQPGDENEPYFIWGAIVQDSKLMLASSKANVIMEFDMENGNHKLYQVGPVGSKYFGMANDGVNYWLIPYLGKNLICWNKTTGAWKLISDFTEEMENNSIPYRSLIKHKNTLYVFPFQVRFGLKVNLESHLAERYDFNLPDIVGTYKSEFFREAGTAFNLAKLWKSGVAIAVAMYDFSIIIMDFETGESQKYPIRIPLEIAQCCQRKWVNRERNNANFPCKINPALSLRVFVDYCSYEEQLINEREKLLYKSRMDNRKG